MTPKIKRLAIALSALAVTLVLRTINPELWREIGWAVQAAFLALLGG